MNNDEIKKRIQELSDSTKYGGRSKTIKINFEPEEPKAPEKPEVTDEPEDTQEEKNSAFSFFDKLRGKVHKNIEEKIEEKEEQLAAQDEADDEEAELAEDEEALDEYDNDESEDDEDEEEERESLATRLQDAVSGIELTEVKQAAQKAGGFLAGVLQSGRKLAERKAGEAEPAKADTPEAEAEVPAEKSAATIVNLAEHKEKTAVAEPEPDKIAEEEPVREERAEEPKEPVDTFLEETAPEKPEGDDAELAASEEEAPEEVPTPETEGAEAASTVEREAPKPKRKAPVEDADFESDAAEFRSAPTDAEEEQLTFAQSYRRWRSRLYAKGIGTKELVMMVLGIVILLLILIVGMSVIGAKQKSKNVTADDGLTVTVEKEPTAWTNRGEVTLGIRTGSAIDEIEVNGESYPAQGNRAEIAVVSPTEKIAVAVKTGEQTLHAEVEVPKIDEAAPVVTLAETNGLVTIDAKDERSGVAGVYYGKLDGFSTVPAYQPYTEPFTAEEGVHYAYYAVDQAGNIASRSDISMKAATALTVSATELTMFVGEEQKLTIGTEPVDAFVNGLQITNSNESVISVSDSGQIKALTEGEADIVISADGLTSVTTHVTVKNEVNITISAVGDVTLGDDVNFSPLNSFSTVATMNDDSYFFANVVSVLGKDDITFANFEGTLTTQGTRADKQFAFRGDPSYTQILKDGSVEVVTLANNHSSDYGEVSLTDTEQYLTQAGIDYVTGDTIDVREVNGIKVGLIGIYTLNDGAAKADQVASTITAAKNAGAQIVVVAFHWGEEGADTPTDIQKSLAHTAIDHGADLVVGHHPHVLQGIEQYNGKYIAYSLGNFCFGGNSNPVDMDTMIFQQTFTITGSGEMSSAVQVIPCSISSDTSWNNYQPTIASGEEAQRIMTKINERSAAFGTETFTYAG